MSKAFARSPRALRSRSYKPVLEVLEERTVPSAFWGTFAGNAQHTGVGGVTTQPLNRILWQTPVDLNPQYQGGDLLEHYGSPLLTQANTILVPVKTGASGGFEVNAFNAATGAPLWTETTDYALPPHNWVPGYSPALTPAGRLYYPGAGGTVYYVDNVDGTPTAPTRLAYFGIGNYNANRTTYDATVFIDTPITSDANGDIFFGVRVTGGNPLNLASGVVRIDAAGNGSWVSASSAAADGSIGAVPHNIAPALSNDGHTLYVGVVSAGTSNYGYLLGLDSTTLATRYRAFLWDPRYVGTRGAGLLSDGTSSPMVGPDGDVYYGVMGNPYNGSRGFLLHFDATLTTAKTPGGFGWDSTPVVVPASMDPLYTGTSSYLLFEKFNNYAGISDGGDGVNRVALLDPNASMADSHPSSNGLRVMNDVMSMAGPTPDPDSINAGYPNAVREWCINTALVDPGSQSILMPSEDGNLYRFDLATCSFSQAITVDPQGIGEAYVPTLEGPDGTVYTIENATLFAVGRPAGGLSVSVISSEPDDLLYGSPVTFTAVVTLPPAPVLPPPTGSVTFTDGTTTLATIPLDNTGHASFTTSSLAPGHHFMTGTYSGDSHYPPASMELVQPVLDPTTTTLRASINPVTVGQSVTYTAIVSHGGGSTSNTLNGVVTFRDGSTVLGTVQLSPGMVPTFTTSYSATGRHAIMAVYGNDHNFADSTSAALSEVVSLAAPVLTGPTGTVPNPVTVAWRAVSGAASYQVWLTDMTAHIDYAFFRSGVTATSLAVDPLTPSHLYRVMVRGVDANGLGPWSGGLFAVAGLTAPAITSPSGTVPNPVTVSWQAVATASSYQVWVTDMTAHVDYAFFRDGVTATSLAVDPLTPGHQYRVEVRAADANGGLGPWGAVLFNVTAGLAAPVLTSPPQYPTNPVTVAWQAVAGAATYQVWVSDMTAHVDYAFFQAGLTLTSAQLDPLPAGHVYRLLVRAVDSSGNLGPWAALLFAITG